jgi:hypothetical protein
MKIEVFLKVLLLSTSKYLIDTQIISINSFIDVKCLFSITLFKAVF